MTDHLEGAERAQQVFDAIVAEQMAQPGVTLGRMFQSDGLKIDDKLFAMLVRGELGVKLPAERVTEEVDAGHGERMATRPDRPMREWLAAPLRDGAEADWHGLADEARTFVASQPAPRRRARKTSR